MLAELDANLVIDLLMKDGGEFSFFFFLRNLTMKDEGKSNGNDLIIADCNGGLLKILRVQI